MAPFKCDLCNEGLDSRRQASKHFDKVHGGAGTLSSLSPSGQSQCDNLNEAAVTVKLEELDPLLEPHPCPQYILPGDFDLDEEVEEPEVARMLTLDALEKKSSTLSTREAITVDAKTGKRMYNCQFCSKQYGTSEGLLYHWKTIHPEFRRYHCSICDQQFTYLRQRNQHRRRVHLVVEAFSCDVCGEHFSQKSSLKTHNHTVDCVDRRGRRFPCRYCSSSFLSQKRRDLHMRSCNFAQGLRGPHQLPPLPPRRPSILLNKMEQN